MSEAVRKSVITCDLEGRIETFNDAAAEIFGYTREDIIGKKRVSLFSPGEVVLEHVPAWLKTASEQGEFQGETVFVRGDGTPFAARVRITPTYKAGTQIGFCGVTEPLAGVDPAAVMPPISRATRIFRWLVITRAPFLTAIIVPVLIGAAWVALLGGPFPWGRFVLALLAGVLLHIAANTFNDYFDWTSGTDPANNNYFQPYSGGSRSLELRLITESELFKVAVAALGGSALLGLILAALSGPGVLIFGLVGALAAYFYTAPPLRLAARHGLGELIVGMSFGPLATAGTVYALTGQTAAVDFLLGLPVGLLTAAILWINQFPDEASDRATGKRNLVVTLGLERARWGYALLLAVAFALALVWTLNGTLPIGALLVLATLPLAIRAVRVTLRHYADRSLVQANVATIRLHMLFGLLLTAGLLLSPALGRLLGL